MFAAWRRGLHLLQDMLLEDRLQGAPRRASYGWPACLDKARRPEAPRECARHRHRGDREAGQSRYDPLVNSFAAAPIPRIESLRTGSSLACEGGLQAGDEILELGGYAVDSTVDFNEILQRDTSVTEFDVLVLRDGQEILLEDVPMIPKEFPANEEGEAGVFYGIMWKTRSLTFPEVLKQSFDDCVYFGKLVWMSLGMIVSGEAGLKDMSGPVGIVSMMSDTVAASGSAAAAILNLLFIGAFIAVNLGLMNLLPIPALDGGRVVGLLLTTAVEAITKKKIDPKYEGYLHGAGMILLLALMAIILFKDIFVIVQR